MAQEEIKLIGTFKDDITPKLQKMNRSITTIGRSFERFASKLKPITKGFNTMAVASERFSRAMASQATSITASGRAMRGYRQNAAKMAGAMKKVTDARVKAQRQMGVSRAQTRKGGGGGGGMPGMGGGSGGGKGGGGGSSYGASAAKGFNSGIKSIAIGSAIGNMASTAIMKGMSGLKSLVMAPFKKFGSMFAERVGDEMDDIKSAGGLFSLDMDLTQESGNEKFFKNYNEALRYQEKLNISMAESAASLPGVTSQYVDTSRQLTDTIQMVMEKDRDSFNKMAEGFGANISMGGVDASKNAMQTVLQKQTEQVMLQSQGQTGGLPMHIMIQQLMGKEAKNGSIGVQAMTNKFRAAFQKNPLLKNFLMRAEGELSKTAAGSAERLQILMETFDKAMPKEVINKMRGSISGMQEALRSGLLDPQAGLFGMSRANIFDGETLMKDNVDDLGRTLFKLTEDIKVDATIQKKLEKMGRESKIDEVLKGAEFTEAQLGELGYKLNAAGKIINKGGKEVGSVSQSSTYIFEQIREILAGYGPVLLEFVGFLPSLFDPFAEMTKNLIPFRDRAQKFVSEFNSKLDLMEDRVLFFANSKDGAQKGLGATLKKQIRGRAALSTVAEYLDGIGGINKGLLDDIQKRTGDTSAAGIKAFDEGGITEFVGPLLQSLLNSDLMKEFGKIGGLIIGGITKSVIQMLKGITGLLKDQGPNKFMEGFMDGVSEAFGGMSFNDAKGIIVTAATDVISKALDLLFTQVIPNLIKLYIDGLFKGLFSGSPVTMLFSVMGFYKLGAAVVALAGKAASAAVSMQAAAIAAKQFAAGAFGKTPFGPQKTAAATRGVGFGAKAKDLAKAGKHFFFGGLKEVKGMGLMGKGGGLMNLIGGGSGKAAMAGLKVGGKLGAVGGIIKAVTGMASGKSPLDAISEGLGMAGGSAIGAAIGTIIAPGIGTAIGAFIGGQMGESENIVGPIRDTLSALMQTLGPTFDFLGQILGDLGGLINGIITGISGIIPGMSAAGEGFNLIRFAIFALLSPFKLLQIGILGLYEAYLSIKNSIPGLGLNEEEQAKLTEVRAGRQKATDELTIEGRQASGYSLQQQKDEEYAKWKTAATDEEKNRHVQYIRVLDEKISKEKETGPGNAKESLSKVDTSAKQAGISLGQTDSAAKQTSASLEKMQGQVEETGSNIKTILEGAATDAGAAITMAAKNLAQALSGAAASIKNAASASASASTGGTDKAGGAYGGYTPGDSLSTMPLGKAIETEKANMPSGADLVIANSSETIIPAFAGNVGEGFKGLKFEEMESAAGFNRMASYTDQIKEIADKTAQKFSGGGALGGGSATLNAMEALGNAAGLTTTSGFRPGDPGFHGANRARDLSNGGGETPEMNKVAAEMASKYGSSLTELIYTPLGYSIKNGAKTGLISPDNHYHHIHVAVAEGLQNAAVFSSQQAAESYEKSMMPAGASPMKVDLSSMTANSSEFAGGGGITVGDVNVSISGVDDPKAIANQVAEEILYAIEKTTYREVFTS